MGILSFKTESVGQSGVDPRIIYITTNNTSTQVQAPGFLNSLVSQGIDLFETDVALVVTRPTPNSRSASSLLFDVDFSGGDWSLVPITGGGGGSGWLTDASNTGAGLKLGTAAGSGVGFGLYADGVEFGNITAGGDVALGFGFNVTGNSEIQLHTIGSGADVRIEADNSDVLLTAGAPSAIPPFANKTIFLNAEGQLLLKGDTNVIVNASTGNAILESGTDDVIIRALAGNVDINYQSTLSVGNASANCNINSATFDLTCSNSFEVTSLSANIAFTGAATISTAAVAWTCTGNLVFTGSGASDFLTSGFNVIAINGSTVQIGTLADTTVIGNSACDVTITANSAGYLKLNGLTSTAVGGTIKPLLIETAAGPNQFKVYYET